MRRAPLFRFLLALGIALPLGVGPGVTETVSSDSLPATMERIENALSAGRPAEAEALARLVIRDHPGFAEAYGELARALAAQGRGDEAVAVLLEVGQGLTHAGLAETGADYLERAVGLAPNASAANAALGYALLVTHSYDRAARHLERAMELGERGLAVRIYLGSALWESGRPTEAETTLREALSSSGGALPALRSLGGFLVWRGEYTEAVALLREAIGQDPESLPLQLDLARAFDGAGKRDEAIAAYRRLVALDPALIEPRYALARLLRRSGHAEEAEREMETFRRLHAEEQDRTHRAMLQKARLDAGWELIRQGRFDEAAAQFGLLGSSVESLSGLAAAQSGAGDDTAAVRTLERAVALAPDRVDLKIKLAQARFAKKP